jgi:esterase/lipase
MMLIGTSLGGCLKSILAGEVSEEDVLLIIARTEAKTVEGIVSIAERYCREGNPYSRSPSKYQFDNDETTVEEIKSLAARLYEQGKIHQPRNYINGTDRYLHQTLTNAGIWVEVNPIGVNSHPAVIEAYEKYRILDELTK